MNLRPFIFAFALLAAAPASAQEPPKPVAPTARQELDAVNQLCDLARYANRMQADGICAYFVGKFTRAAEAEEKAKEPAK